MAKNDQTEAEAPAAPVDPRKEAWAAFLAKARAQAVLFGTTAVFDAQKERGEFDTIPESFTS